MTTEQVIEAMEILIEENIKEARSRKAFLPLTPIRKTDIDMAMECAGTIMAFQKAKSVLLTLKGIHEGVL